MSLLYLGFCTQKALSYLLLMLFFEESQDSVLYKLLSSLVIKGADDQNLQGGLGVTNKRVCVAKPLSGISKSQTWVFVFCKGQEKK